MILNFTRGLKKMD